MSRAVWLLALGQTLTYAGVYYAFPALLPDLIAETGWSVAELAFGPTLGFLVMAGMIFLSGRGLDRGFGPLMMVAGPVLAALCLLGLGFVRQIWQWNVLWLLIGLAQAGCLYETCFAILTRILGDRARGAITRVTLVAGFAGTLAFPLGHYLGAVLGGQGALAAFAGLVVLAAPVNYLALRRSAIAPVVTAATPPDLIRRLMAKPMFWGITLIFTAMNLSHGILMTYILLLFQDRGAAQGMATLAAAAIGPSQVLARLVLLAGARISNAVATLWALGAVCAAAVLLIFAGAAPVLIFGFALMQGAGAGLMSVLRPVLVADRLGRVGFGAISAVVSVGPILATAAAPALGAILLTWGGAGMIYGSALILAVLPLILGLWILRGR